MPNFPAFRGMGQPLLALFLLSLAAAIPVSGDSNTPTQPPVKATDYSQQSLSTLLQRHDDIVRQIEAVDGELSNLKTQLYWTTETARLKDKLKQPETLNGSAAELATLRRQEQEAENSAGGHTTQETNDSIRAKESELSDLKKKEKISNLR